MPTTQKTKKDVIASVYKFDNHFNLISAMDKVKTILPCNAYLERNGLEVHFCETSDNKVNTYVNNTMLSAGARRNGEIYLD